MRNLVFYDNALVTGDSPELEISDLKAKAKEAGEGGLGNLLLREANEWRGELEVSENRYPDNVFLLTGGSNPSLFSKLRSAYEEVGVKVSEIGSDLDFRAGAEAAGPDARDRNALMAEATALSIPFTETTSDNSLRSLIADEVRAKQLAKASLAVGRGDAQETNKIVNRANARVGAGDANARADNRDQADMATEDEDDIALVNDAGEEAHPSASEYDDLDVDGQTGAMERLQAEADGLGVNYAPNIGYATLLDRVEEERTEKAEGAKED